MVDGSTVPNVCFADHAATFLWLIPCSWGSILDTFSRRRLSLYDLGNTPDILLDHKTQVLASVEIQYGGRFLVHPSPDGLALRIFVLASETIEDEHDLATFADVPTWDYRFQVYEIYPHHDHPQFVLLSDWLLVQPMNSGTHLYSINLNRIVFKFGDVLKVWDFVAETSAMWRVPDTHLRKIIIAGDAIILLGNAGVSVWNIPPLLPHDREHTTLPHADIPILNPLFRIDYPEWMPPLDYESVIQRPGDWYAEPWCYDIVTPSELGFEISRYRVIFNMDMTAGTIKKTAGFELVTGTKRILTTSLSPIACVTTS